MVLHPPTDSACFADDARSIQSTSSMRPLAKLAYRVHVPCLFPSFSFLVKAMLVSWWRQMLPTKLKMEDA